MTYLIVSGCSKTDSITSPNANQQASFQISQRTTPTGSTQFLFRPGVNINISRIVSRYSPEQFADTLTYSNTAYVYSKDTTYIINNYLGVQNGQQWNFDFTGTIPGQVNSNYNVTVNYTAQ